MKRFGLRAWLMLLLGGYFHIACGSAGSTFPISGAIVGRVRDAETGEGLGWVSIHIPELRHGVSSHANGEFHLFQIPAGEYELHAVRIGYRELVRTVSVSAGDTLYLQLVLSNAPVVLEPVETEIASAPGGAVLHHPVVDLGGGDLQREMGTTLAESVDEEPGIAQRSMGPAPARPVLRGLGADRLLLLEDGQRTGDLSATASDHAVAIEPLTAERVEVIRGPEALLYSSGALGGVINVERDLIPVGSPHRFHGSVTAQGESASQGLSGGLSATIPVGSLALKLDGSQRATGDLRTPRGTLKNTTLHTSTGGAGLSLIRPWGMIGIGGNLYESKYGIPGGFVGAHPRGVSIKLKREHFEVRGVRYFNGLVQRVEGEYSYADYYHAEYESNGSLGMEFGVQSDHATLHLHLGPHAAFANGLLGFWAELRDYATGGLSFTPRTAERQMAVFFYERGQWGRMNLQSTLRVDAKSVRPEQERVSSTIGLIHARRFHGVSGSLQADMEIKSGLNGGLTITRSWRPPGVEELFSEGPHLASYSYEIGNPELAAEEALGAEVFSDVQARSLTARFAFFHNWFERFIFPRNTGRFSPRRADLYEYRYSGLNARFQGFEMRMEYHLTQRWQMALSGSYVKGTLTETIQPLPQIPPLTGHVAVDYQVSPWIFTVELNGAAAQTRTAEFEEPTAAWSRLDASIQVQQPAFGALHSIVLGADNLLDTEYRNHLSRVKVIMPEPGRNVKFLYRLHF